MRIRKSFWAFAGIVFVAFILAWYAGRYSLFPASRVVFYRIAVLGSLFILVNWVWTLFAARKINLVRVQRVLKLSVGSIYEERYEIKNESKLWRLWTEIEDQSLLPGNAGSKVLSQISPRHERFYISRTILIKRGAYRLGPTVLRSGDPFGMFISEKTFPADKTLNVLPYMETIDHMQQFPGFYLGGHAIRQKSLEATSHAAGVRDYAPGDPLNRIHWKSSARKDRFMVKEFDQDPQGDVWILLDASQFTQFEAEDLNKNFLPDTFWAWRNQEKFRLPANTFEYSVSIVASLANYFIKADKPVGVACADRQMVVMPPEKGERQFGKIMDTLAFLEGKGELSLNELIGAISHQIPRGSSVYLVTAGEAVFSQIGLEMLLRKRLNPFLVVVDKDSFGLSNLKHDLPKEEWNRLSVPQVTIRYNDSIREKLEKIV
jgi:uncharacterized protein (DUF58 family)